MHIILLLNIRSTKAHLGHLNIDVINENEMGESHGTHWREQKSKDFGG